MLHEHSSFEKSYRLRYNTLLKQAGGFVRKRELLLTAVASKMSVFRRSGSQDTNFQALHSAAQTDARSN